jgi:hypothetical protein
MFVVCDEPALSIFMQEMQVDGGCEDVFAEIEGVCLKFFCILNFGLALGCADLGEGR